jgi:hypothetical protein
VRSRFEAAAAESAAREEAGVDDRLLALKGWKRPEYEEEEEEEEDGPVRLDRRPDERQRESDYMERRQALVERTMRSSGGSWKK